jgi:rubrerythrin
MSEKNERALRMLKTALEMETKGHQFYGQTLKTCANPAGREIFQMLMEDEVVHTSVIGRIYDALTGGQDWSAELAQMEAQDHEDLSTVFRQLAVRHGDAITASTSDLEALEVGIDFEKKAVRFYQDALAEATDPLERRFVELMVAEEKTHVQVLADMKLYLTQPQAWFQMQERSQLDG